MTQLLQYKFGDATNPEMGDKPVVIAHICNDIGVFGAGFVVPLAKRYPVARDRYIEWAKTGSEDSVRFELGNVQFVKISDKLWIANMIGQKGIGMRRGPPIRYDAVDSALLKVAKFCKQNDAEVAGPRFGSGLAGGSWHIIESLIVKQLCKAGISVTIYDLKPENISNDNQPTFGW